MHVEGLPLAQQLAAQSLADGRGVVLAHVGQDRPPVGRRGVDHGEVPDAGQRHLEGARDRAGREREHVDTLGHTLDRLLVRDPEALLLVDHQEAKVLERHVLGQQTVGADDHVDAPVGQALDDLALLRRREEAAEQLDPDRIRGVAVGEGLGVLAGEQRGRRQHGGLRPVLHRLEHRTHGDLGLAEADVAADQAVHRPRLLHVPPSRRRWPPAGPRSRRTRKRLHLGLPRRVGTERPPVDSQAPAVQLDQLGGHLTGGGARPGTRPLPVGPAHLRQRRVTRPRVRR